MKRVPVSMPELAIVSGTRAALGLGVGLLVADAIGKERRKGLGWALVGVGLITTIPILMALMSAEKSSSEKNDGQAHDNDETAQSHASMAR